MRGTRSIEDPKTHIRVTLSRPAQILIGTDNVNEFVRLLMIMMGAMGCDGAYVGKDGAAVQISMIDKQGWHHDFRVKRGT